MTESSSTNISTTPTANIDIKRSDRSRKWSQQALKNTITNQNKSLNENLTYLQNKSLADKQVMFYHKLQTQYLVIVNFYLFYLYMLLAIIFGYFWFFVKEGYSIQMKWFWYLHILILPYLLVYTEFVCYYFFKIILSLLSMSPLYVWNNYTSFPPVY
jgi:hypothetical protein